MSAYLLTWNPTHFSNGTNDSGEPALNYQIGEEVRWSCKSKQPVPGDTVYLIKLGVSPKGIVAKGRVTRSSFQDSDWKDSSKTRDYIQFKVEGCRETCAKGMLHSMLLRAAFPAQQWSPQSSGVVIQAEYEQALDAMWSTGSDSHSFGQLLQWEYTEQFDKHDWLQGYKDTCKFAAGLKGKKLIDEEVERLWYGKSNGVASVGQGLMYRAEFDDNVAFLRTMTESILDNPSVETYQQVAYSWTSVSKFKRTLWSVINRVFAAAAPEKYTCIAGKSYLDKVFSSLKKDFELPLPYADCWPKDNRTLLDAVKGLLPGEWDVHTRNIMLWHFYDRVKTPEKEIDMPTSKPTNASTQQGNVMNQILFGPPGTGKTFHTINKALEVLDPELIANHSKSDEGSRAVLKQKFDDLVAEGRIRFITFHQSFSYEDFVEGLRADTNETPGQVSYKVEDGVFKSICRDADEGIAAREKSFTDAFDKLVHQIEANDGRIKMATIRGKEFDVEYNGGPTVRIFPLSSEKENPYYLARIDFVQRLYNGESEVGMYGASYVRGILQYLQSHCGLPSTPPAETHSAEKKPFVLIIDEINRGNVSRIFGELITLIEPSKRQGKGEALSVVLPYSKTRFSVPDNVYIIGTMNTSDRSLAGLDIALRRRFSFTEMPPRPELLEGVIVEEQLSISDMLSVMNQRISVLLDKDHCLGHAYFMPLLEDPTLEKLAEIFKQNIIPLLQEYFFEDWERIRWVLNDQSKEPEDAFFTEDDSISLLSLFPNVDDRIRLAPKWRVNDAAFNRLSAYEGIIAVEYR